MRFLDDKGFAHRRIEHACNSESIAKYIIPLCKHVVAKVTLVPCSVNLTGKRDQVGHGEVTINNARIIPFVII